VRSRADGDRTPCARPRCSGWIATRSAAVHARVGKDVLQLATDDSPPWLPERFVVAACKRCGIVHVVDAATGKVVAIVDTDGSPRPVAD
jgi:hypothetical protein